jgi:hypothetical protein
LKEGEGDDSFMKKYSTVSSNWGNKLSDVTKEKIEECKSEEEEEE